MNTNDKTLADVQPGGRVRLGNGLPEAVAQALATVNEAANDARHAGNYKVANALVTARVTLSKQLLALSAQPSPGGQDAMREAAEFARSVLAEIYATYQVKIGPFASQAQLANVKLGSALAARQPVGEPVARSIIEEFVQCADVGRPPGKLLAQARDYLAAPPAPAVDLERFRPAVMTALGLSSPYGLERETLNELLDLIDGKGVGK